METLSNKTVLLTGAAGGIGRYIAKALLEAGASAVCVGRSRASLDSLQRWLQSGTADYSGRIFVFAYDLQRIESIPDLVQKIERSAGPIDALINNAAIEKFSAFQDYSLADIQATTTTNLLAPMALCHAVLPRMLMRGGGHIVNISSGAGKHGAPFNSVYSATKAGLINWSEGLRLELADSAISVSVVCPGITDAGMFHALETEAPEGMKITPPSVVADAVIQAILNSRAEVVLDGLPNRVFAALSQLSPELGDHILRSVGIVETNRECADRLLQKERSQKPDSADKQTESLAAH